MNTIKYIITFLLLFFLGVIIAISSSKLPNIQLVYLFSHGIAATYKQSDLFVASKNKNGYYIITDPLYTFNYPDATENFWRVNFWKSSLGQKEDIDTLRLEYKKALNSYPYASFVIIGISRGASTAINFCALDKPEQVKALILESPFDSIETVVRNLNRKLYLDSWQIINTLGMKITELIFKKFKKDGLTPGEVVHLLPHSLPVLIIASKEDVLIPWSSSYALYEKLKNTGHYNVFFILLNHGKHGFLFTGPEGAFYESVVHAFYKKYGLPYDKNRIIPGKITLDAINQE